MSLFTEDVVSIKAIYLNVHNLPKNEYDKLDDFMKFPNEFGIHTAIYANGVIVYIEEIEYELIKVKGFPILANILSMAYDEGIRYVDFYDDCNRNSEDLKIYDW